jgi:hypothetical protein
MTTLSDAKSMAQRLRTDAGLKQAPLSHAESLEIVAHVLGYRDWNTCHAAIRGAGVAQTRSPVVIPILRTFPGGEAQRFYVGYLRFTVDWEHRFEEGSPLYQQVSRGGCILHLSEHHGDATPGAGIRIAVTDLARLRKQLFDNDSYPLRPGISELPWGQDMVLPDPFGNRLVFHQPLEPTPDAMQV